MEMFDKVTFFCLYCGEKLIKQSKAGACDLKKYHHLSIPATIAEDLKNTEIYCSSCKSFFIIYGEIPRVTLYLIDIRNGSNDYD